VIPSLAIELYAILPAAAQAPPQAGYNGADVGAAMVAAADASGLIANLQSLQTMSGS
jgi:hypothetical protein